MQICKYFDDFLYSNQGVNAGYDLLEFSVSEGGNYTFSVSQKGERMFPADSGYEYSSARMTLAKLTGDTLSDGVSFIKATSSVSRRDTYLELPDLEEGTYFLLAEVDWIDDSIEKEFQVTSYGTKKVRFTSVLEQHSRESFLSSTAITMLEDEGVE